MKICILCLILRWVDPTFVALLEKEDTVRESEDGELLKLVRQLKELIRPYA